MPLPVINNVFRVTLNWSHGALNAANVIHVRDVAGTHTALEVATAVRDALHFGALGSEVFRDMFAATTTDAGMTTIEALELDGTSTGAVVPSNGVEGGAGAGDMIPAGSAVVTLRTAVRGRQARGRVYTPFVREANQAAGLLTAPTVTDLQAGWGAFGGALLAGATQLELVVASYLGAVARAVTSVTAQTVMGTQRRRQSQLR